MKKIGEYLQDRKLKYTLLVSGLAAGASALYKTVKLKRKKGTLRERVMESASPLIPREEILKLSAREIEELDRKLPRYMKWGLEI